MYLLLVSVLAVVVPVVGMLLDGRSDRALRFRSTLDAAVQSRSLTFTSGTWVNYGPDVQSYNGAVRHEDGTARPVPSSVARFL